jgi:hypothetical protein
MKENKSRRKEPYFEKILFKKKYYFNGFTIKKIF